MVYVTILYFLIQALQVIGVMSCSQEGNVMVGYEKYLTLLKQFSDIGVSRCFAVEPLDTQPDLVVKDMVMIPNQDDQRLEFYIDTLMNDIALELLKTFEARAADPKSVIQGLPYPLVSKPTPGISVDLLAAKKMELVGQKLFADYALLVGDTIDAIQVYQSVVDQCRLIVEPVLLAGSLQGLACAIAINQQSKVFSINGVDDRAAS